MTIMWHKPLSRGILLLLVWNLCMPLFNIYEYHQLSIPTERKIGFFIHYLPMGVTTSGWMGGRLPAWIKVSSNYHWFPPTNCSISKIRRSHYQDAV